MAKYHYLGAHCAISGDGYAHVLTQFGQPVELPEAAAENHAIHGARLVPAADFEAVGFTSEELEQNSDLFVHHLTADEAFLEKRKAAWDAADRFRAAALAGATSQEI